VCGGRVHGDMARAVTRAGQGGECSGREGREALSPLLADDSRT
jgi:hypothetical protein